MAQRELHLRPLASILIPTKASIRSSTTRRRPVSESRTFGFPSQAPAHHELDLGSYRSAGNRFADGWQISGVGTFQSGRPFSIIDGDFSGFLSTHRTESPARTWRRAPPMRTW